MTSNTFFTVTYDIVTPQIAETGFELAACTLREAWDIVRWGCEGGIYAGNYPMTAPRCVTFVGVERTYRAGAVKAYTVNFPTNITPASARRVARLLGAR